MKLFSRISERISEVKKSVVDSIPSPVKKYAPAVVIVGAVAATAGAAYLIYKNKDECEKILGSLLIEEEIIDNGYANPENEQVTENNYLGIKIASVRKHAAIFAEGNKAAAVLTLVSTVLWIASALSVFYFWMNPMVAANVLKGVKLAKTLGTKKIVSTYKSHKKGLDKKRSDSEIQKMVNERVAEELAKRAMMDQQHKEAPKSNGRPNPLFNVQTQPNMNRAQRRAADKKNKKGDK